MTIRRTPRERRGPSRETIAAPEAETIAVRALVFLAREPARIERFFALTGLRPEDVRALAHEPAFQLAVLEHLASDERLLLAFVAAENVTPESVAQALRALGGGEPG